MTKHTDFSNVNWESDSKKNSRLALVSVYSKYMQKKIPSGKQYWSMCGANYKLENDKPQPIEGEFQQLISLGLINSKQWHGVDIDSDIIRQNKKVYPNVSWHHGDFFSVMEKACIDGWFSPSLINYDSVRGLRRGLEDLKPILYLIDANVKAKLFLSANFVIKSPYRKTPVLTEDKFMETLIHEVGYNVPDHWSILNQSWHYTGGTGKRGRTEMATFFFVKTAHDGISKFTPNRNLIIK